jgi:hypothetical protein
MSTDELKAWLQYLEVAFAEMEYGSYEWDTVSAEIEYVTQILGNS